MVLLPLGILKVWRSRLEAQGPSTSPLDGENHACQRWLHKPPGVPSEELCLAARYRSFLLPCGGEGRPSPSDLKHPCLYKASLLEMPGTFFALNLSFWSVI